MELIEVVNTQYAFPVGMVIIIGVLVFAFGFKSAQEPPFDQLTFPADDRKPAGKKRKLKDKKPQPNGHVTTQLESVPEKPVEKEVATKVTPRQHRKDREKERKNEKLPEKPVVRVEQKPEDFDEGQWVQALSRREKKNKNKKVGQNPADGSVEKGEIKAVEDGDEKQLLTVGVAATTDDGGDEQVLTAETTQVKDGSSHKQLLTPEISQARNGTTHPRDGAGDKQFSSIDAADGAGDRQLPTSGTTLIRDGAGDKQLPTSGTTLIRDGAGDKQLPAVGTTQPKDGTADKSLLTAGSVSKVSTPSKKKKKKNRGEDSVEEQMKTDICPVDESEKLGEPKQTAGGLKGAGRSLSDEVRDTGRTRDVKHEADKSVDVHIEVEPSVPDEVATRGCSELPLDPSEQQLGLEKRSPRKKKESKREPEAESCIVEGSTVETSPAVSKRRKKKKSHLTATESSTKVVQEAGSTVTSSSMPGHAARASDTPSISVSPAQAGEGLPLLTAATTNPKTDISSSTGDRDPACPSNDTNQESSGTVVHTENVAFEEFGDAWKEAKPQKKKRKVRRDQ